MPSAFPTIFSNELKRLGTTRDASPTPSHKSLAQRGVEGALRGQDLDPQTMPALRPYSRPATLAKLDQRTKEARLMRETAAALTAHVGGKPSETQKQLIRQAVQLRLRLEVMDRAFAETRTQTEHDSRTYLAWSGALSRTLRLLGLDAAPTKPPTLADYLAQKTS